MKYTPPTILPIRRLVVAPSGGHYTTLSAALAAITDASASNEYQIEVHGAIAETAGITAKSHVHVTGMAGASVTVTSTGSSDGFTFNGLTNMVWRGLKLVRAGAISASDVKAVYILGGCTATVQLIDCVISNTTTGGTYADGMRIVNTAAPTLLGCRVTGGGGNNGRGLALASTVTPIMRDCHFTGGASGADCNGIECGGSSNPTMYGCTGQGGAGGQDNNGIVVWSSATGQFYGCAGLGGSGGTYCRGIQVWGSATPLLQNCTGIGGGGGTGSYGLEVAEAGAPMVNACVAEGGNGATGCPAIELGENGAPIIANTRASIPRLTGVTGSITGTTTLVMSATKPLQIAEMSVYVAVAGGVGATVSIGTTEGGTDVINAQAITTTDFKSPVLGSGALTLLAANAPLYVTIAGAGTPTIQIYYSAYISFATCQAVDFHSTSNGAAQFYGCALISNCASDGVAISSGAVTANKLRFSLCHIEARPKEAASLVAINAAAAYNPAPIYNCFLVGGVTNITAAAAGSTNGTNNIL